MYFMSDDQNLLYSLNIVTRPPAVAMLSFSMRFVIFSVIGEKNAESDIIAKLTIIAIVAIVINLFDSLFVIMNKIEIIAINNSQVLEKERTPAAIAAHVNNKYRGRLSCSFFLPSKRHPRETME